MSAATGWDAGKHCSLASSHWIRSPLITAFNVVNMTNSYPIWDDPSSIIKTQVKNPAILALAAFSLPIKFTLDKTEFMNFTGAKYSLLILSLLPPALCSCRSTNAPALQPAAAYPAHWFQPVSPEGAPAWEILPQAAGPGEVILSKRNELGLLSNFAATPFTFHQKHYASLEGFWQMMKYPEDARDPRATFPGLEWAYTRDKVAQLTSFDAKHAGDLADRNLAKMGITWVSFEGRRMEYRHATPGEHYQLIVAATREKVRQNPEVAKVLLATGNLILKPDHHQEPNAPAAWRYYEILTQIRTELQQHPQRVDLKTFP